MKKKFMSVTLFGEGRNNKEFLTQQIRYRADGNVVNLYKSFSITIDFIIILINIL